MPFIFPEVSNVKLVEKDTSSTTVNEVVEPEKNEETLSSKIEKYKRDIGFGKVEASRITLDNPDNLKALVLLESKFQDLDIILPYLQFAIGFKEAPVTYTFGREVDGKPATLITFITEYPIEKVFEATKKFGVPKEMDELRSTLKVVEVVVNRNILKGQPTELTNDSNHPRYFDANYYELIGIDRSKQIDAVRRLRTATVKGRQADISSALTGLITKNDHELSKEVIATLYHWTRPEYENDQSVINYAKEIVGTQNMSRPVMDYLADKEVPGSAEILSKQWASVNGHLLWESHLVRAKKRGEQAVIYALPNLKNTHYKSVASILNKIGTSRSISAINTVIHKASPEDQKYLKATIDEIKSRQ